MGEQDLTSRDAEVASAAPGAGAPSETVQRFVEQWTLLRLQSPSNLIARFDEAAKQLIAVGAGLHGVYIATYAFGGLEAAPAWVALVIFLPLLAMIFFAARCVCEVPKAAEAMGAFRFLKKEAAEGRNLDHLELEIDSWCQSVDALAERKRRYLHWANWSFVVVTLAALGCLVYLMATEGPK